MTEALDVSVVIPTRDRWAMLSGHALPSALSQADVAIEVIVVDDGSRDGTSRALAALDDPRIRVVTHEESRGVSRARNAGIGVARGGWIAFLDDDDLWSPRKLRTQLDVAAAAGAAVVYAAAVLVDERASVLAEDVFPDEAELESLLRDGNVIPGGCSNVLARRELVCTLGGFDERLTYTEDWELWIRLLRAGSVATSPEVLVAHVDHRENALLRYQSDVLSEVEYVLRKHDPNVDPRRVRAARARALEWIAYEHRRAGHGREAARSYLRLARERRSVRDLARAAVALSGPRGTAAARVLARRPSRALGDAPRPATPAWLASFAASSAQDGQR